MLKTLKAPIVSIWFIFTHSLILMQVSCPLGAVLCIFLMTLYSLTKLFAMNTFRIIYPDVYGYLSLLLCSCPWKTSCTLLSIQSIVFPEESNILVMPTIIIMFPVTYEVILYTMFLMCPGFKRKIFFSPPPALFFFPFTSEFCTFVLV